MWRWRARARSIWRRPSSSRKASRSDLRTHRRQHGGGVARRRRAHRHRRHQGRREGQRRRRLHHHDRLRRCAGGRSYLRRPRARPATRSCQRHARRPRRRGAVEAREPDLRNRDLSDSAPLHGLVADMVAAVPAIHCLRDPTRGGLGLDLERDGPAIARRDAARRKRDPLQAGRACGVRAAWPRPALHRQ